MAIIYCGIRVKPVYIEIRISPTYYFSLEGEIDSNPSYIDIKRFIQYQEYPSRAPSGNKKTLKRMTMKYYIDSEILYKRSFDGTLLGFLKKLGSNKALR